MKTRNPHESLRHGHLSIVTKTVNAVDEALRNNSFLSICTRR